MILIAFCVIFDHTRGTDPRLAGFFKTLPIGVCGVVRAEVLLGVRTPADRVALVALLNQFVQAPIPEDYWQGFGRLPRGRCAGTSPSADLIHSVVTPVLVLCLNTRR